MSKYWNYYEHLYKKVLVLFIFSLYALFTLLYGTMIIHTTLYRLDEWLLLVEEIINVFFLHFH